MIDTPYLRIRGNCLEFQNVCIQLSNISVLTTSNVNGPAVSLLISSGALVLLGGMLMVIQAIVGFILMGIGCLLIFGWLRDNSMARQSKQLTIITNSGNIFPIVFSDQKFLGRVVDVILDMIRDPKDAQNITVNMHECRFMDNSAAIGTMYDWK